MAERVSIGWWSVLPPSGWKAGRQDPIRSNAEAIPANLDPAVQVVAEQARLLTDELTLEAQRQRFGLPVAGMMLVVGARSAASLDALADASLVASRSFQPQVAEALNVIHRRWIHAAGAQALELQLTLKAGRMIRRYGWLAGIALRLMGVDPIHGRVLLFDRDSQRHLAAVIAGRRDFESASSEFDALIASSEFGTT